MSKSSIEWTESTWNPVTGCDKVSKGCKFCYAEVMAKRLKAMNNPRYLNGFKLTLHEDKIDEPRKWKKDRVIFVNSMSDLFHPDVPLEFIQRVFKTMNETPQHTYQVLTKRSERLAELSDKLTWTENIWMGVSIEDYKVMNRMDGLKYCEAKTKFISAEPLLGPLYNMDLKNIHWVIVGGESGFKARPIDKAWVIDIKNQCDNQNVPFFFKQWGGKNKKKSGNLLDGKKYEAFPNNLQLKSTNN
jgi:protein gp37